MFRFGAKKRVEHACKVAVVATRFQYYLQYLQTLYAVFLHSNRKREKRYVMCKRCEWIQVCKMIKITGFLFFICSPRTNAIAQNTTVRVFWYVKLISGSTKYGCHLFTCLHANVEAYNVLCVNIHICFTWKAIKFESHMTIRAMRNKSAKRNVTKQVHSPEAKGLEKKNRKCH